MDVNVQKFLVVGIIAILYLVIAVVGFFIVPKYAIEAFAGFLLLVGICLVIAGPSLLNPDETD